MEQTMQAAAQGTQQWQQLATDGQEPEMVAVVQGTGRGRPARAGSSGGAAGGAGVIMAGGSSGRDSSKVGGIGMERAVGGRAGSDNGAH